MIILLKGCMGEVNHCACFNGSTWVTCGRQLRPDLGTRLRRHNTILVPNGQFQNFYCFFFGSCIVVYLDLSNKQYAITSSSFFRVESFKRKKRRLSYFACKVLLPSIIATIPSRSIRSHKRSFLRREN